MAKKPEQHLPVNEAKTQPEGSLKARVEADRTTAENIDAPRTLKRCACGRTYTVEQWPDLRLIGFQRLEDDLATELRECAACHSTIGIVVHVVPCAVARIGERP
jgi:hypothetical protein